MGSALKARLEVLVESFQSLGAPFIAPEMAPQGLEKIDSGQEMATMHLS